MQIVPAPPVVTSPPGTVPPGPPLCQRLPDREASAALGFAVAASDGATSISCVYTSPPRPGASALLAFTASDAGDTPSLILAGAKAAASSFSPIVGLGDGAYVAIIGGRPQAALITKGRQYSLTLSSSPALPPAGAKRAMTAILRSVAKHLSTS